MSSAGGRALPADVDPAPQERRVRTLGLAAVLLVFGGFGTWAALAPLSSAAIGQGVISVESYRKTVQHLEGGIVKEIRVREGDLVEAGQVLVVLDDTRPRAELEVLRGQLLVALAREARLSAQRDQLPRVAFPGELLNARDDPRAAEAMRVQLQTFTARKLAHEGEVALYERQVQVLRSKARGLAAQLSGREKLVASFESERADFDALVKEGYAERQRLREMERNVAEHQGQHGALTSELAGTQLQVGETQLKIVQLGKELQREVAKELAEVQSELFQIREKMRALSDTVARVEVRAPDAGRVLGLDVHTLGAVINPGGRLLDIVPQHEKLIVEAELSPHDIDQVRVGQDAEVRFPAFKMRSLPRIDGRLVAVSADRLLDERGGQKVPYYRGRVEIGEQGLKALAEARLALQPGMPAEVLVNTGERTLLQYLMAPVTETLARSMRED